MSSHRHLDAVDPGSGTILGLDNVALELPLARVGSRVLAALLDYLVLAGFLFAWVMAGIALTGWLGLRGGWSVATIVVGAFLLEHGYFVLQEIAFEGQTLGKRALSLRVVGRDGSSVAVSQLLVRNLVRVVDLIIGVPLIGLDRLARRVGDRLAATLVVHHRPQDRHVVLGRLPEGWSNADTRTVEAYLRRAGELEPSYGLLLGRRLEGLVDERAPGFLPSEEAPGPFERLAEGFQLEMH